MKFIENIGNNETMSDPLWTDDPEILYKDNRFVEFFPTTDQTNNERINSLSRLAIYSCGLITLYTMSFKPLIALGIALVILVVIGKTSTLIEEPFETRGCTAPTRDNPFMNVMLSDYYLNPDRPPACDSDETADQIEDNFNYNLYRNVGDVFGKYHSQREFVTNPSTTIPNDRESFSQFLFGNLPSCKDNPYNCEPYSILKNKRKPVLEML